MLCRRLYQPSCIRTIFQEMLEHEISFSLHRLIPRHSDVDHALYTDLNTIIRNNNTVYRSIASQLNLSPQLAYSHFARYGTVSQGTVLCSTAHPLARSRHSAANSRPFVPADAPACLRLARCGAVCRCFRRDADYTRCVLCNFSRM